MNENPPPIPPPLPSAPFVRAPRRRRHGTAIKLGTVAVLTLLLLIPLTLIRGVLAERLQRRDEAVRNITATWGEQQVVAGPVLIVPYKYRFKTWKEQVVNGKVVRQEIEETATARAHFLPAALAVDGALQPDRLHRGIYETVVYRGQLKLSGRFARPNFDEWKVAAEDVMWEDAQVAFAITDLRGAKDALVLQWDGQSLPLTPGARFGGFTSGVHARLKGAAFTNDSVAFDLALTLNGSRGLSFAPVGTQNEVRLTSPWPDPSFTGAFLPSERKISGSGFEATWQVSYYGRSYPQQWSEQEKSAPFDAAAVNASLFGVDLISVVDSYRLVERSTKYGLLFIVLVFTTFFLFEVLAPVRIHPFQYVLVGAALCLFYLALLSLSEITGFGGAYAAGAAGATLMVTLYSAKMLRSFRRTAVIAGGLSAIYGFLYVILRQQDYSLLFGTAGLFLVLAVVMYTTRNIDWYARDEQ